MKFAKDSADRVRPAKIILNFDMLTFQYFISRTKRSETKTFHNKENKKSISKTVTTHWQTALLSPDWLQFLK